MICKNCNTELFEGALFCHKCGTKAETLCASCNKALTEGAIFCPYCGNRAISDAQKVEHPSTEELLSTEVDEDWFANNKSVYINMDGKDFNRMYYQGMIYFISRSSSREIWRMYEDGSELEHVAIRDEDDNNRYIGVNRRGIFTYDEDSYVYHYSFKGKLINIVNLQNKYGYVIRDIVIFDNRIYYLTSTEEENYKQEVLSIGIDGTNPILIYRGTTKKEVSRILANNNSVFLYITFNWKGEYQKGWYRYDLKTAELTNLNSVVLPPHEILTNPKRFDGDSRSYIEDNNRVEIFSFDLVNNIMWTFASEDEAKRMSLDKDLKARMIFPRNIGVAPNQAILEEIEPWILPVKYINEYYIFNGESLYYLASYYRFYGIYRNGTKSDDWNQTRHGRVETMQLTGNTLIGDIYADYRDYGYTISIEKPSRAEIVDYTWKTPSVEEADS